MTDALADLSDHGVSIWLDDISRHRLVSGNLDELISDKHVVGVTSNPSIFQKALEGSAEGESPYAEQVHDLAVRGVSLEESVRLLTAFDIRWACDVLRPTYDATTARTAGSRSRSTRGSRMTLTRPRPRRRRCGGWWTVRT